MTWAPGSPRWCGPIAWLLSLASARCGSKMTPSIRPDPSRTGWFRWRSPRPRSSASRWLPAPRPATWPTRWPPTRPRPAWIRWCSSRLTSRRQGGHHGGVRRSADRGRGNYDDVNRLCAELAGDRPTGRSSTSTSAPTTRKGPRPWPSRWPSSSGWQAPDHVVVPVASGSQLTKVAKGFRELYRGTARTKSPTCGCGRPGGGLLAGGEGLRRRPRTWSAR